MELKTKTVSQLARLIQQNWPKVNYAAKPYLGAMVSGDYGFDGEKSVILGFLANASSWRGEVAKAIKAELKERLK